MGFVCLAIGIAAFRLIPGIDGTVMHVMECKNNVMEQQQYCAANSMLKPRPCCCLSTFTFPFPVGPQTCTLFHLADSL